MISLINSYAITVGNFQPVRLAFGFILMVCVIAIVIIAVKWLLGLAGVTIPQPLMIILGILLFMVCLIAVMNWSGLYSF